MTTRPFMLMATLLATTAGAATYTDSKYGFSLTYPANWQVRQNVTGAAVALLAPRVGNFSRNVNVVVGELPQGTTLNAVYAASLAALRKVVTDFKVVSERGLTMNGQTIRELVYTGRQGQYDLRQKQRYVLNGNRAYVLTATGLQSDAGTDRLLDPVLDSFKFGK